MRTYSSRSGRYGSRSFLLCLTQFRTASNTGSSESTYTCTLTFRFVEAQTLVAKLTLFVASNFQGLDMRLLHATINVSPNIVITPSELMDCGERQEFNNTKGCFLSESQCVHKTRLKGGLQVCTCVFTSLYYILLLKVSKRKTFQTWGEIWYSKPVWTGSYVQILQTNVQLWPAGM